MRLKNLGKNMASLQKNINTIILKLILFSLGTDIVVSPDRVITECEFIDNYTGDYSDPYGFMIHLLDKENTVLTVSNGTVLEKKDCFDRKIAIDKIIHKAHLVTVRGRGDAEAQVVKSEFKYTFKNHGTYSSNGRSLNFLAIWNDKGQCYSAFNGEDDDCKRAQ
jgi:hypothetical protein